jgi:hypothetical protein
MMYIYYILLSHLVFLEKPVFRQNYPSDAHNEMSDILNEKPGPFDSDDFNLISLRLD